MAGPGPGEVRRDEFEALQARVRRLEAQAGAPAGPPCLRCGFPSRPGDRFCTQCGASLATPPPKPAAPPSLDWPPPRPAFVPVARPEPVAFVEPPKPAAARTLESTLGQRLAPRLGALLVFLAAIFFLGLGIERGWIGPVAQLVLAALVGLGLGGVAWWLAGKGGYGAYPQILAGTGVSILYVDAFVAHALPYYADVTGVSALASGLLMGAVAAGTIGVSLWKEARVLVGLGYVLGFLTAGVGWGVLPALTLAYVALLGTSLALVVAWRRWMAEAALGTLATGLFLAGLAWLPPPDGAPSWAVALASLPPVAAFFFLALRKPEGKNAGELGAMVAFVTLAWGVGVSLAPLPREPVPVGVALLAWCAAASGLMLGARRFGAEPAFTAFAAGAFILFVVGVPTALHDAPESALLTTASYALAALGLVLVSRRAWMAAGALALLAMARAILLDERLAPDGFRGAPEGLFGPWQAWATLAAIVPALAILSWRAPEGNERRVSLAVAAVFLAAWVFALFREPFLSTLALLALAGAFALLALSWRESGPTSRAIAAGLALAAALKTGTVDAHAVQPALAWWLALAETLLVAGVLLAIHHVGTRSLTPEEARVSGGVLVGGSAALLASYAFAYFDGAWVSVALGILGVAYLAAGFVLRAQNVYRYAGFGVLGLVLLRVFVVDLGEADLAVRAGVFALLGAILLGVGYAYARLNRPAQ